MPHRFFVCRRSFLAVLAGTALGGLPAAAGEQAFPAFSPLLAVGEQSTVGDDGVTRMQGSLSGPLYAQTDSGPVERGMLICDFELALNSDTLEERGSADCTITPEGEADGMMAEFTCTGALGDGCVGEFVITGGEGRFSGASGGGEATLTARDRTFGLGKDNAVRETIYGLAHWDRLVLTVPD